MPAGMDGAPPSLDLSEFPSLTNRSMGQNESGSGSSLSGRPNYGEFCVLSPLPTYSILGYGMVVVVCFISHAMLIL